MPRNLVGTWCADVLLGEGTEGRQLMNRLPAAALFGRLPVAVMRPA